MVFFFLIFLSISIHTLDAVLNVIADSGASSGVTLNAGLSPPSRISLVYTTWTLEFLMLGNFRVLCDDIRELSSSRWEHQSKNTYLLYPTGQM